MIGLGLSFAKVAMLGGFVLGALALLFLLRARRVNLRVVSILLFRKWAGESRRSALSPVFRRPLSFLLHVAIALLLLSALSDPRAAWEGKATTTVLLIDVSASMQATDVPPNRLAAAKASASAFVESMGGRQSAIVVAVGSTPVPKSELTNDREALLRAIRGLTATDAPADLHAAVEYAASLLHLAEDGHVRLFSDGQNQSTPGGTAPVDLHGAALEYEAFGAASDNAAITECAARRSPLDHGRFDLLVEVTNTGATAAREELTVVAPGGPVDVVPLELEPGMKVERSFRNLASSYDRLELLLSHADGGHDYLSVDDHAYAAVPPSKPRRVLLVSAGDAFLEAALRLDRSVILTVARENGYEAADARDAFDIIVFEGVAPKPPLRAHSFYVGPAKDALPLRVGPSIRDPGFDQIDKSHPIMRHLELADVNIKSARALVPESGDRVLASSGRSESPLLVAGVRSSFRFVALGFDLRASDLPLRAAFPVFIHGVLSFLAGDRGEVEASQRTGLQGVDSWDRVGFFTRTAAPAALPGEAPQLIAVNLANVAESTISPQTTLSVGGLRAQRVPSMVPRSRHKPWVILVGLALLLALVEWVLFHLRVAA